MMKLIPRNVEELMDRMNSEGSKYFSYSNRSFFQTNHLAFYPLKAPIYAEPMPGEFWSPNDMHLMIGYYVESGYDLFPNDPEANKEYSIKRVFLNGQRSESQIGPSIIWVLDIRPYKNHIPFSEGEENVLKMARSFAKEDNKKIKA